MDFKVLISLIEKALKKLEGSLPSVERELQKVVLLMLKDLDTHGDNIRINATNLKKLSRLNSEIQKAILNLEYISSVREFIKAYDQVTKLQNQYFRSFESNYKPPAITKEIVKIAKEAVVNKLTSQGLEANITDGIKDIIRRAITSGSSYSSVQQQLGKFFIDSGDGRLTRYVKQIATDGINQFSGQYSQILSSDLGFEWFRYSGSNIRTTRPFCLACTDRKFFHISEIPAVLKGDFPEFEDHEGVLNKDGDPAGFIPGTDITNFMVNRGGYNCGHQWRPVSESLVPKNLVETARATTEYKLWKAE